LQQKYTDIEIINLAQPGNSNQGIFSDIAKYLKTGIVTDDDILMFHGTLPDRIQVADDESPDLIKSWVIGSDYIEQLSSSGDYNQAKNMYVKHLYNDEIGINLSMSAMLASYGLATGFNLKFLWSLPVIVTVNYNKKTDIPADHMFRFVSRRKFMWGGLPMNRMISPALHQHRIDALINHDFSKNKDVEFNNDCHALDNHVNDTGHALYFENVILPTVSKLL
jgi:hypothetical protein